MPEQTSYQVYTLELGPFNDLTALHRELSNHTSTFVAEICARDNQLVVSISHSIVSIDGKLCVSAITTTVDAPCVATEL